MIEHVYRRTSDARLVTHTIVATDDARIAEAVEGFGGFAVLTRADHETGTDRLAEVAADAPCGIIVNVQGDEPLIDPSTIDLAVRPLLDDPQVPMSTLSRPLEAGELDSPHVVKVVTDRDGFALYFSRAPIPYARDGRPALHVARGHVGLYAYRRDVLRRLAALPPTPLERVERLEQLRALEHGVRIKVVETTHAAPGVDTEEDLERARQRMNADYADDGRG